MALGRLLERIERQAAAEREALLREGRARAERLEASARHDAALELERALEEVRARAGPDAERRADQARRSARRRVLEARERMLSRLRAAALERLPAVLARSGAGPLVDALVDEACAYLDPPAILRCPPGISERVRARVAGRAGIRVEPDPSAPHGVVGAAEDGTLLVDATLEALVDSRWVELAIAALTDLEREGGAP